jgi:hypothetical protein
MAPRSTTTTTCSPDGCASLSATGAGQAGTDAADVLGMATLGGAKLMGKEGRLGRLAPGYEADIVLLDLERILAPWTAPEVNPLDLIVLRAGAQDVRNVLVAGKPVYGDGRALGFDEAAVARNSPRTCRQRPIRRSGAACRGCCRRISMRSTAARPPARSRYDLQRAADCGRASQGRLSWLRRRGSTAPFERHVGRATPSPHARGPAFSTTRSASQPTMP